MEKHHTTAHFRAVTGEARQIEVAPGQERALYDAGFTIYYHNVRSPAIDRWLSALTDELGLVHGVTRLAAFASLRGLGLKPHYDQNDNFICQARGAKRFRLWPNTHVRYPTRGYQLGAPPAVVHQVEAPDGLPGGLPPDPQVVELRPGSVMFMPRGMWHDTETVEDESLHFNIQSGLPTWRDVIEYALTRTNVLHREDLRAPIVGLFTGDRTRDGFEAEFVERLRSVVDDIYRTEIVLQRDAFYRFVMGRRPIA
jgi:ribosomal protein L16 Arg81 hydroxylase